MTAFPDDDSVILCDLVELVGHVEDVEEKVSDSDFQDTSFLVRFVSLRNLNSNRENATAESESFSSEMCLPPNTKFSLLPLFFKDWLNRSHLLLNIKI